MRIFIPIAFSPLPTRLPHQTRQSQTPSPSPSFLSSSRLCFKSPGPGVQLQTAAVPRSSPSPSPSPSRSSSHSHFPAIRQARRDGRTSHPILTNARTLHTRPLPSFAPIPSQSPAVRHRHRHRIFFGTSGAAGQGAQQLLPSSSCAIAIAVAIAVAVAVASECIPHLFFQNQQYQSICPIAHSHPRAMEWISPGPEPDHFSSDRSVAVAVAVVVAGGAVVSDLIHVSQVCAPKCNIDKHAMRMASLVARGSQSND
ncbi:hypothetical protein EVG20_g965 [Dentipellis fragilis]|uniref:Uncharacterized protein n=1 Tax=Dentipellis fragilis TaxID=205917 RepID=A0A4Y9ZF59_9AGAM|nr:hypothetical protein EVG20_g965 [Dentipellis fragilis]